MQPVFINCRPLGSTVIPISHILQSLRPQHIFFQLSPFPLIFFQMSPVVFFKCRSLISFQFLLWLCPCLPWGPSLPRQGVLPAMPAGEAGSPGTGARKKSIISFLDVSKVGQTRERKKTRISVSDILDKKITSLYEL